MADKEDCEREYEKIRAFLFVLFGISFFGNFAFKDLAFKWECYSRLVILTGSFSLCLLYVVLKFYKFANKTNRYTFATFAPPTLSYFLIVVILFLNQRYTENFEWRRYVIVEKKSKLRKSVIYYYLYLHEKNSSEHPDTEIEVHREEFDRVVPLQSEAEVQLGIGRLGIEYINDYRIPN